MANIPEGALLWSPKPEFAERSQLVAFRRWLKQTRGLAFADYEALRQWSVTEIEAFWAAYLSPEYKDVATFSILILVLMFRPSGLLGRPEVEKV